ncbi:MAG: hypothetical protein LBF95_10125 [Treponema sp.]|jgi:hypothetical protein|nr:hypothetical protein [Treponema sp.]
MAKTGSKGGYGTFAVILVSALLAIAVFLINRLEVYERVTRQPVSEELSSDNFYVLGKWLSESGHPVRFSPRWAGIKDLSPQEGGLFLMASLVDWETEGEPLVPWVREGGSLIISVDPAWYWRMSGALRVSANLTALETFLKDLGLVLLVSTLEDEDGETDEAGETGPDGAVEEQEAPGETGDDTAEDEIEVPNYDWTVGLELAEEPRPGTLVLRDERENIRLIRIALGKGHLTVTGSCYFMYNYNLRAGVDAKLTWELTGASLGAERPAMLFVRGRRAAGGLFATLRERGNLWPPLVSIAALVLIGFWTVIPGFGVRREEETAGHGAMTGRFAAEARFLQRYGAYGAYLEAYLWELRRRSGGRKPGREIKEVEAALASGKKIGRRKIAVYLKNLMSALERI